MKYFAFDLETTGTVVKVDQPMQIAYAVIDDKFENYIINSHYINSKMKCSDEAFKVHGITNEIAKSGISLQNLGKLLLKEFKENNIDKIIAVNGTRFDIPILVHTMNSIGIDMSFLYKIEVEDPAAWHLADLVYKMKRPKSREDYIRIYNKFRVKGIKFNLSHLCKLYNIKLDDAHNAVEDVRAMIELWKILRIKKDRL